MAIIKINVPFVRSPYNYDADEVSDQTALRCKGPSRTQQNFKDECDINRILDRWTRTGSLGNENVKQPQYGDFTGVGDYHSICNNGIFARDSFSSLPDNIRKRFGNDPAELLSFLDDPKNRDEAEKLGLIKPVLVDKKESISPISEVEKL